MIDDRAGELHRSIDTKMLARLGEAKFCPPRGSQQSVGDRIFVESIHSHMGT